MVKMKRQVVLMVVAALGCSVMIVNPAYADDQVVEDSVAAVTEIAPPVTAPELVETNVDGSVTAVSESGTVVELPSSTDEPVSLHTGEHSVAVGMPGHGEAQVTESGEQFYAGVAEATDVVVEPTEGGFRALIHIQDSSAPTAFDFPVDVPEGGRLELSDSGGALVLSATNEIVVAVDVPWAKDADGNLVETHFTVEGNRLTQLVSHGDHVAYPVVADPLVLAVPIAQVALRWVAGKLVRSVLTSYVMKRVLERQGYSCSGWTPWVWCSIRVG